MTNEELDLVLYNMGHAPAHTILNPNHVDSKTILRGLWTRVRGGESWLSWSPTSDEEQARAMAITSRCSWGWTDPIKGVNSKFKAYVTKGMIHKTMEAETAALALSLAVHAVLVTKKEAD